MIIGIDLDGVVFDTEEYFRTYSQLYDMEFVKNGLINSQENDVHKRYGWTNEIADDFYKKHTQTILENAPLKPAVKYVLEKLKRMGHTLVCITLRGAYHDCEIDVTEKRLKQENIKFDKIFYNQHNKLETCKSENVDLMIEDNANNALSLAQNKIKCLHLKASGLKSVNHENVTIVQNWADILEKINKNMI